VDRKIYYIYKLTNTVNGKAYIGYTENIAQRWRKHELRSELNRNGEAKILHQAIRKHGWSKFTKEIICCGLDPHAMLHVIEPLLIAQHNTYYRTGHGYNMTTGGEGTPGLWMNAQTRRKMSDAHAGENNSFFGKTHTAEARRKISEVQKATRWQRVGKKAPNYGKKRSAEAKRITAAKLARQWWVTFPDGKAAIVDDLTAFCKQHHLTKPLMFTVAAGNQRHHKGFLCERYVPGQGPHPMRPDLRGSDEARAKMSETKRANPRKLTEAERKAIGDAQRGRKRPLETGKKIGAALAHRWQITDPRGRVEIIENLSAWCRQHGFSVGNLHAVATGKLKTAYGYKCKKVDSRVTRSALAPGRL
jgi:group I intron endonuclease